MAMGMYSAMLRATGDALTPSLISVLVCVLDIFFNFFLINPTREMELFGQTVTMFGFGWGVPGAALGTALCHRRRRSGRAGRCSCCGRARSASVSRQLEDHPLLSDQPLAGGRAAGRRARRPLLGAGGPCADRLGLGTVAIAANSLGVSAEGLCYMAGYGIQDASIALIGQAVGANRKDMAKRFAWLCTAIGIGIMALSGIGLWVFAPALMGIFTRTPPSSRWVRGCCASKPSPSRCSVASIVASGAMQGAGDSTACFVLNLVSMWGIRLTLAFLLAPRFGLTGVWAAMCLELCTRGVLFLLRLARGKWLDKGRAHRKALTFFFSYRFVESAAAMQDGRQRLIDDHTEHGIQQALDQRERQVEEDEALDEAVCRGQDRLIHAQDGFQRHVVELHIGRVGDEVVGGNAQHTHGHGTCHGTDDGRLAALVVLVKISRPRQRRWHPG